jgi:hypothetical protein
MHRRLAILPDTVNLIRSASRSALGRSRFWRVLLAPRLICSSARRPIRVVLQRTSVRVMWILLCELSDDGKLRQVFRRPISCGCDGPEEIGEPLVVSQCCRHSPLRAGKLQCEWEHSNGDDTCASWGGKLATVRCGTGTVAAEAHASHSVEQSRTRLCQMVRGRSGWCW